MDTGVQRKLLVVDDDSFVRECCTALLTAYGYYVESASHGMEALDRLKLMVFDLVISDINMPKLNGIGLFKRVEAEYPYLKDRFLFITGAVPVEETDNPVFASMSNRLIKKPFKPAEIVSSIKTLTSIPVEASLNQAGGNRRAEERRPCVRKCLISLAGSPAYKRFVAETLDISISGMRVKYMNVLPLDTGFDVSVAIEAPVLLRHGSVMWSKTLDKDKGACSGLRVAEAIPVSELLIARA
ncbi:MAG: response regulator [Deltaproteobacteria bacterium]|nr:response regulator [Deltaproteobacteria bacterium]